MKPIAALLLTVTAYAAPDHAPVGATGEPILPGITAAVSREHRHLLGTWVYVPGHGPRYLNDVTARHVKGTLDLAVDSRETAREIGRKRMVEVRR